MKCAYIFFITVLSAVVLSACRKEDNKAAELIIGHWEVEEAFRNGRPTESLADLYFEFSPDGKISTNFSGVPEEGTYEIKGSKIAQRDTRLEADYNIESITADNLVLTTELRGYKFRFVLKKGLPNDDETAPEEVEQ